jgi:hypothetical protein
MIAAAVRAYNTAASSEGYAPFCRAGHGKYGCSLAGASSSPGHPVRESVNDSRGRALLKSIASRLSNLDRQVNNRLCGLASRQLVWGWNRWHGALMHLPKEERNALLHLFSAAPDRVEYGAEHYRMQSADTSTIVKELFGEYRIEGLSMPYTMKDFHRDVARKYLRELTPEERLSGLAVEERLAGLPAKEIAAYLKQLQNKSVPAQKKKGKPGRRTANDK